MASVTTVGELIQWLSSHPPELPVILSSDAEGNRYSCLAEAGKTLIDPDDVGMWDIEIYVSQEVVDDPESVFDPEWDSPPENAISAVVLVPIN